MNLQQLIQQPTRITATTESLLDIILVSDASSVLRCGTINNPISDHLPVFVELRLKSPKLSPQFISVRSYKNYDPDLFITDLASRLDSLLPLFAGSDVNNKLAIFDNVFCQVLDVHTPVKTIKIRNCPCPFISSDMKTIETASIVASFKNVVKPIGQNTRILIKTSNVPSSTPKGNTHIKRFKVIRVTQGLCGK